MSAVIDAELFLDKDGGPTKHCAVVSIYEDLGGRNLLIRLCDSLARKFKDELDFQFDWCRFKYLADPGIAMESAQKAAEADLILFSPQSPDLPSYVQEWIEGWLPNRKASAGALVLVQSSPKQVSESLPLRAYLRLAAKKARLDYLRLGSAERQAGLTEKEGDFSLTQPYLNELLTYEDKPLHWGINE